MDIITNKALLTRKQAVAIEATNSSQINTSLVLAIMTEIAQLGYTFDKPLMDRLAALDSTKLKIFRSFLVEQLQEMVGSHVRYVPLFKSFPDGIPDTTELMLKKIIGYFQNILKIPVDNYVVLSCGHTVCTDMFDLDNYSACPICEQQVAELMDHDDSHKASEPVKQFKIIKLVEHSVVYDVFSNILDSKTSISETDKALVEAIVKLEGNGIEKYLPEKIDQKETIAFLADKLLKNTTVSYQLIAKYFKTATDVLRLAVQFSEGDVTLQQNTKFKLSNAKRKLIMALLNNVNEAQVDMVRYREQWIKLGEVIHIGTYKNKYSKAYKAFDLLRNHKRAIETFNGKVEELVMLARYTEDNESIIIELVTLLSSRAGEFARRFDQVLRLSVNQDIVIDAFEKVVPSVKTAMLLGISKHLLARDVARDFRAYIPKGKMSKIQFFAGDDRKLLTKYAIDKTVNIIESELLSRFSNQESLGKVYIDPELANVLVPFSQRSASTSLVNIPRGSRIKIDDKTPFIRLYTYWKASVDVDLGATMLDKNFKEVGTISYYNLSSFGRSVHSGDIRDGHKGATEFIDLDLQAFRAKKIKYVVVNLISFTGEKFSTMECFAGFMERETPDSKQFDATTVRQKFNITSESSYCIPMIFDIETNEVIWLDLVTREDGFGYNYHNNKSNVLDAVKAGIDLVNTKTTLMELFNLHAHARGELVHYKREEGVEYDTVFDIEKLKDLDEIMSKYLA